VRTKRKALLSIPKIAYCLSETADLIRRKARSTAWYPGLISKVLSYASRSEKSLIFIRGQPRLPRPDRSLNPPIPFVTEQGLPSNLSTNPSQGLAEPDA
jgi:hypothetical protein